MDVVDLLVTGGGVGVLPTDAGYGFVTPLNSKAGLERLLRLQAPNSKPMTLELLCSNMASIDEHCYGIDKQAFKILKKNLPGLYTFVLPVKTTFPKGIATNKDKTIGVRMPNDPVLRYLQDELLDGLPLLFAALPVDDDDEEGEDWDDHDSTKRQQNQNQQCYIDREASWCNQVDFMVDAGPRPYEASTVYDLTRRGDPILVREGLGDLELAL